MRGLNGYATLSDPAFYGGHPKECDTFTCGHCNSIVHVKPAKLDEIGGRCSICDALICNRCLALGRCDPIEEKIKRMEAQGEARRSYGI